MKEVFEGSKFICQLQEINNQVCLIDLIITTVNSSKVDKDNSGGGLVLALGGLFTRAPTAMIRRKENRLRPI